MRFQYKKDYSFEQRKLEGSNIRRKFPDRVPVILEKSSRPHDGSSIRRKYLVPGDMTVGHFHHLVWKSRSDSKGLWFFVDNVIPPSSVTMSWLYEEHHDDDFFLYIAYSEENVFGR